MSRIDGGGRIAVRSGVLGPAPLVDDGIPGYKRNSGFRVKSWVGSGAWMMLAWRRVFFFACLALDGLFLVGWVENSLSSLCDRTSGQLRVLQGQHEKKINPLVWSSEPVPLAYGRFPVPFFRNHPSLDPASFNSWLRLLALTSSSIERLCSNSGGPHFPSVVSIPCSGTLQVFPPRPPIDFSKQAMERLLAK